MRCPSHSLGPSSGRDQRGVGLIALPWGVLAYVAFLMLAVQIAAHLYSTTVVTAVGHDATRRAALGGGTPRAVSEAESWLRSRIGSGIEVEELRWHTSSDVVSLELVARPPNLLIDASGLSGLRRIERRFDVRREVFR